MESVKLTVIGILTFFLILIELIIGFGTLTLINIPRIIIPFKFFKIFLAKVSNQIGDITVYGLKLIMLLMHGNTIQVINEQKFDANQTLNMPFVNRHSKEAIKKNPSLRHKDYKNTLKSCKRFLRTPSTIFSYAEGTRFTDEKHALQGKKYKNLLSPKVGGMATALSAMPNIDTLIDFSLVYKSNKRGAWSFLTGEMKDVKVFIKSYAIPTHLKHRNYSEDKKYRDEFKKWIEEIWSEKDQKISELKF